MGNKAIQKQPAPTPAAPTSVTTAAPRPHPEEPTPDRPRRKPAGPAVQVLKVLASLRLTVVLFVLSIVLVFYGTVAQMDKGVWTVVDQYFRSFVVFIPLQLNVQVAQVFFGVPQWVRLPGSIPFPGGWTLGVLLLVNLLAAHAVRLRVSWARGGVLVLHAGLILLLVGELLTGLFAVEGSMILGNGETSNVVIDSRKTELAVVDSSDPKQDDVVVVPGAMLRSRLDRTVAHGDLPFDVVPLKWMVNSGLAKGAPKEGNIATAGEGLKAHAVELPEVTGTDPEQKVDTPSAYVKFVEKGTGRELGAYLVSLHLDPQTVEVGGKKYDVSLRFKHMYKPYTVELVEFRHDLFPGTGKPKNFSSEVRVVQNGEERHALISMNNPMRLIVGWSDWVPQVDTLFQASFLPGNKGTILQVVDNRSWLMPYIACTLVTIGMLWHFGFMLPGVLAKAAEASKKRAAKDADAPRGPEPAWVRWAPVAAACLAAFYFAYTALPPRDGSGGLHLQGFARLPVQEGGRGQPFDTLARNTLMMLSDRQEFYEEKPTADGRLRTEEEKEWVKRSAVVWLLDVMTASLGAEDRPYFKVDPELASLIELGPGVNGRHSLREISQAKGSHRLTAVIKNASGKMPGQLDDLEKAALDLGATVQRFRQLDRYLTTHRVFRVDSLDVQALLGLPKREGHRFAISEFAARLGNLQLAAEEAREAQKRDKNRMTAYQIQVLKTWEKVGLYMGLADYVKVLLVPPLDEPTREHWASLDKIEQGGSPPEEKAAGLIQSILYAYKGAKNPALEAAAIEEFNKSVADYQKLLNETPIPAASAVGLEQHYNKFAPFYQCLVLYGLALVLVVVGWLLLLGGEGLVPASVALQRSAFWVMVVTVIVHTAALCVRMYLQGRPPVTNLYSSAIFIGWACVLLGLFLDVVYKTGLGTLVGAVLGFLTSIIAFHLATTGDTLEMMQAVLDTNLWLSTHVTTVTLGYGATFIAGFLGIAYLAIWLVGELNGAKPFAGVLKVLATMIYGVVCFATLLSFVGTVLGGIWADQSWGRFWGWDPKENGAVLIVIWNALILHARWAGLVKATGVAALAIVGNMITVWSWFGTNQLGVGLHAYGFSNTLALFCVLMWISHALVLCVLAVPSLLRMFEVLPPKAS